MAAKQVPGAQGSRYQHLTINIQQFYINILEMKRIQIWILCIFLKALSAQFPNSKRVLGAGKIFRRSQEERIREKFSELNTTAEFNQWNHWREENGLLCRFISNVVHILPRILSKIHYLISFLIS